MAEKVTKNEIPKNKNLHLKEMMALSNNNVSLTMLKCVKSRYDWAQIGSESSWYNAYVEFRYIMSWDEKYLRRFKGLINPK